MSYENTINYIGRQINRKYTNSFKKLGNNPISLTKFSYISEILPSIDNFMITDKADGMRTFLLVNNDRDTLVINGETHLYVRNTELGASPTKKFILDCECIKINEINYYYAFDVIIFEGINVASKPFAYRHTLLTQLAQKINLTDTSRIRIKKFFNLSVKDYQKNIMELWNSLEKKPYGTDGIIFTERNKNYVETNNYKWKDIKDLTIDFYVKKTGQKNKYYLFNGANSQLFKKTGLELNWGQNKEYIAALKKIPAEIYNYAKYGFEAQYFPVFFSPSFTPIEDIHIVSTPADIDGKIVEFNFDVKKNIWNITRVREDRTRELKSGGYYGNDIRIAEITFQSIINPLNLADLIAPMHYLTKEFYFEKTDDTYISARKMNSFVKRKLIARYKNCRLLLDLASGKGQDLMNYYNSEVKQLIFIERDINAIDDIIRRKYIKNNGSGTYLRIFNSDLTDKWSDIVQKIKYVKKFSVPVIFCNFALHYLISTEKNAKNMAEFINYFLEKTNGVFIFTALNGEKVHKLLINNKGKWEVREDGKTKYMIEFADKKMVDHRILTPFNMDINVLLPCSNTPYVETLIDLNKLDVIFKPHNILRVEQGNHDTFLDNFKDEKKYIYDTMTDGDKNFIGLYKYTIYKRL